MMISNKRQKTGFLTFPLLTHQKKGLSEIIVGLILIIVVIVAVSIVWVVVRGISDEQKEGINLGKLTLDVGFESVYVNNSTNCVDIKVKRDPGLGNLSSLKFMFYSDNDTEEFNRNATLSELETRWFNLCMQRINVTNLTKISLMPVIKTDTGKEIVGDNINTYNIKGSGGNSGGGSDPGCTSDCQGRVCGMDPVCGTLDCGSCNVNETCNVSYQCQSCVPENISTTCGDWVCGNKINNCGQVVSCGTCGGSDVCNATGQCVQQLLVQCNLTNASWSSSSVIEGTLITLTVQGTNCDGKTLNFTVWEYDTFPGVDDNVTINPSNAVFSGNTATTNWISEWQGESFPETDTPEYYFVATLVENASKNIKSNEPKLNVNKSFTFSMNLKDESKYYQKEVFLVSSKDWKNVLELVPLAIWGNETIRKYPLLVMQEDEPTTILINRSEDSPFFSLNNWDRMSYYNLTDCQILSDLGRYGYNYVCPIGGNFIENEFQFWNESEQMLHFRILMKNIASTSKNITLYEMSNPNDDFLIPQQGRSQNFSFAAGEEKYIYFNYSNNYTNTTSYDDYGILKFIKDYNTNNITILGNISSVVKQKLVGYGVEEITSTDYLNFWQRINSTVYVEDNYTLALIAAPYAAMINAPLMIKNSSYENQAILQAGNVICVQTTPGTLQWCDETYNLSQMQLKYYNESGTDKIILTNSGDINESYCERFILPEERTFDNYCKASLVAPIMAAAKKELILFTDVEPYSFNGPADAGPEDTDKTRELLILVDTQLKSSLNSLSINYTQLNYLTIIANPKAIPLSRYAGYYLGDIRTAYDRIYADFTGDNFEDLGVGRIFGISVSDTSVLVAKSTFFDELLNSTKTKFNSTYGKQYRLLFNQKDFTSNELSNLHSDYLLTGQYDPLCKYEMTINYPTQCIEGVLPNKNDYINRSVILFLGHGLPSFGGISSNEIPELSFSIGVTESCSNGNYYGTDKNNLFNAKFIRKGGIAFFGAAGVTALTGITIDITEKGGEGKSFGEILKEAVYMKSGGKDQYLLGDPTLVFQLPSRPNNTMLLNNGDYYVNVTLIVKPGDPGYDPNNLVTTPAIVNVSLNYTNAAECQCTNATINKTAFDNVSFFPYSQLFQWELMRRKNMGEDAFRNLKCRCRNNEGYFGTHVSDSIYIQFVV